MASFKIQDVKDKYAIVEITFDNTTFDNFDDNGDPITVNYQSFIFDNLTTDNAAILSDEITLLVQNKLNEIEPTPLPTDVVNMIGETVTI